MDPNKISHFIPYLCNNELPLGVEAGHVVGVDEVAPLLVVRGLQLHPRVVVRQDVREPGNIYIYV